MFGPGEAVEVTFTFNRPVNVDATGGTPSAAVLLGGTTERDALYLRGSGASQLVFGYTLTDEDGEHGSLLVDPNALALNGGAIRDAANNLDADISHQGGGAIFAPVVESDTAAPQLQSATVDGSTLTLTYNEDLDTGFTPPADAFAVTVNGASRSIIGVGGGRIQRGAVSFPGGGGRRHGDGGLHRAHGRVGEQAAGHVGQPCAVLQRAGGHEQHGIH